MEVHGDNGKLTQRQTLGSGCMVCIVGVGKPQSGFNPGVMGERGKFVFVH